MNPRFGFGLMNAASMVRASLNWTSVPPNNICTVQFTGYDVIRGVCSTVAVREQQAQLAPLIVTISRLIQRLFLMVESFSDLVCFSCVLVLLKQTTLFAMWGNVLLFVF